MTDPGHLRALAHPTRLRILSLLTGSALSAADVARELGLTHANASYHLRLLRDAGELVVAGEESIRGGRAVRYRHPWREEDRPGGASTGGVDPGAAELVVRAVTQELQRRYRDRRRDLPGIVTDAELWVEEETWVRARELLLEAAALVHDGARAPRAEGTTLVNLSLFAFAMDPR
ncbi:helix-turn-helix domain-containing protein [Phycicoccus jejuensis]|uniref:ArsR/SmtB family transcription factor n=1 Tax=Phycicoccus jejuensis TaxID=367299 RepID=UPI00384B7620